MVRVDVVGAVAGAADVAQFVCLGEALPAGVPKAEFSGKALTTVLLRSPAGRELWVGLGAADAVTGQTLRRAAGVAVKHFLRIGAEEVTLVVGRHEAHVQAAVEGALLAAYRFEEYRPKEARRPQTFKRLRVVVEGKAAPLTAAAHLGTVLGESTNLARAWGNLPPNDLPPSVLADRAAALCREHGLACRIWDEKRLAKDGFHGILAVGRASHHPPRFLVIEHLHGPRRQKPVVLVGKAITFDTGGISLKSREGMEEMKWDKMGGLAVLAAMTALARLKRPISVVGLIPCAENMPGGGAWRPGDIISTYDGQTIEVTNTDAEGRVILADALAYGRRHYQPKAMLDFATLTGACMVALGESKAGFFTAHEDLASTVEAAAAKTGEEVWRLPLGDEYEESIKSDVALVKNSGSRFGGASAAACFLRHWAGDVPWVHFDIAGVAFSTKDKSYREKGATGFGVRLAVELAQQLSE
jgi:leucyl aminopeptidase